MRPSKQKRKQREAEERQDRRKGQIARIRTGLAVAGFEDGRRGPQAQNDLWQTNQGELQSYNHMEPNSSI